MQHKEEGLANLARMSLQGSSLRLQSSGRRKLQLLVLAHTSLCKHSYMDQGRLCHSP